MLPTEITPGNGNEPDPATSQPSGEPAPSIPQPQANYATRDDLMALGESVRAIAAALQQGQIVNRTPTAPAEMTDEEIMASINEGKPGAAIKRLRDEITQSLIRDHIAPLQEQSISSVTGLVRDAAKVDPKMPYFVKFEKEIDKLVATVPAQQRAHIDTYRTAYNIVAGQNMPAIIKEEVEKAMRAATGNDGGQTPGSASRSPQYPTGTPSVSELLGADAQVALDARGWTADVYAQRVLKKKDWPTAAADIKKFNEEHPTNA